MPQQKAFLGRCVWARGKKRKERRCARRRLAAGDQGGSKGKFV